MSFLPYIPPRHPNFWQAPAPFAYHANRSSQQQHSGHYVSSRGGSALQPSVGRHDKRWSSVSCSQHPPMQHWWSSPHTDQLTKPTSSSPPQSPSSFLSRLHHSHLIIKSKGCFRKCFSLCQERPPTVVRWSLLGVDRLVTFQVLKILHFHPHTAKRKNLSQCMSLGGSIFLVKHKIKVAKKRRLSAKLWSLLTAPSERQKSVTSTT